MMLKTKVKVCEPDLTEVEKGWVMKALEENRISSTGGFVEKFEQEFARKIGVKHVIAVNSGGSALFLLLWAMGIRKGDEVIMPTFTMIATANAVVQCGATPIFVDSEEETGNIDVGKIQEKITDKTKAIIVVHLYGQPVKGVAPFWIDIPVIEDAAESHGAMCDGKYTGNMGFAGIFSFYANKIITTGEGGAITTDNDELAKELREIRQYDMGSNPHFIHNKLGWNMRMSSLEAAIGLGQLERWHELIWKRIANARRYAERLFLVGDISNPIEVLGTKNVYWMYLIRTERRDELMAYLKENGVETRTGFVPMHMQKFLADGGSYPVAEKLAKITMYLPSSSHLTIKEQDYVILQIKRFYDKI